MKKLREVRVTLKVAERDFADLLCRVMGLLKLHGDLYCVHGGMRGDAEAHVRFNLAVKEGHEMQLGYCLLDVAGLMKMEMQNADDLTVAN